MKDNLQTEINIISKYLYTKYNIFTFQNQPEYFRGIDWIVIICEVELSEDFLKKYNTYLNWQLVSIFQNLSEEFREEFKDKIDITIYNEVHRKRSREENIAEMNTYAKRYNLKFDGEYLYAFRDHDKYGRGFYSPNNYYIKGKYYRDWHCDMRLKEQNSFGFGLWPRGNTPVKVYVDDWGLWVNRNDGKCRVWGFEVIGDRRPSWMDSL